MKAKRKNIAVTQKAIVFRAGKFLTMRRGATAPSHPLAWDLPGGELEYGEDPASGIAREIKEETGLEVKDLKPFDVLGQENPGGFWVTIAYKCQSVSGDVSLSYEHTEYQWVTEKEFFKLVSTPKNIRFVENAFRSRK